MRLGVALAVVACLTAVSPASDADALPHKATQVVFVCEHGNAKSLMAALYFNQLADQKGLSIRAVARGTAPNSDPIPASIAEGLRTDGFDPSDFHPSKVRVEDTTAPNRVILIGTDLPSGDRSPDALVESWTDVPPASVDFAASRGALKRHIQHLLAELSTSSN